ncbi:SDR family oxidoreductase [Nocardioides sp. KR10-350]|uniref:SDR family oxidoreductase n=1 Tax=Nocardioides cheoyonin TaxID=3156615 RepID=UPI0032B3F440
MAGRVIVVTGASAGVGRACARAFADRGDGVALLARGTTGLEAARREVEDAGARALVVPLDVADAEAVAAAAERVERELGEIDVWVNAAFVTVFGRFTDVTAEEYRRVTEVTYLGFVNGTRAALARMLPRDRGTIVQVGSALSYRSVPLQAAYCGAKHAIRGFHESLRAELRHDRSRVRATMVQLPAVNTPQFIWGLSRMPRQAQPVPPIFQPEVAARAIVYAADHPRQREHWVGRSTVAAILGERAVPALLDRYVARTSVDAQQTDGPPPPDRPVNIWEPVDGPGGRDHGARGPFDAADTSAQQWAAQHRGMLLAGAAAVGALVAARRGRRS